MMVHGVIDRFEGEFAVIEVGTTTRDYARSLLPKNAKVGDSVIIEEDGSIRLHEADTKRRKQEIDQLMDELFE
jgi:hydrogenase maturation factor